MLEWNKIPFVWNTNFYYHIQYTELDETLPHRQPLSDPFFTDFPPCLGALIDLFSSVFPKIILCKFTVSSTYLALFFLLHLTTSLLGAVSQQFEKSDCQLRRVCPSASPNKKLVLKIFLWNFVLRTFVLNIWTQSASVKIEQRSRYFAWNLRTLRFMLISHCLRYRQRNAVSLR